MRWDFGYVYKKIRLGKGLSQRAVCNNYINRGTLSRIENENQNTSFETMQYLLDQINVSWREFQYICNEYQPNIREEINNDFYTLVSSAEVEKIKILRDRCLLYLQKTEDSKIKEIYLILESLLSLQKDSPDNISQMTIEFAKQVWKRLSEVEVWTYNDIRIINIILYYLEIDTIHHLIPKLMKTLRRYQRYKNIDILQTTLLINIAYIYRQNNYKTQSVEFLYQALSLAKKIKRVDFIGIVTVRIGIETESQKQINDGLLLLQLAGETELYEEIIKEINR